MATKLPVDFEERVKRSKGKTTSDYPYAIKAEDLMRNFVYGALDVDESLIEETNGQGGHKARKLAIPAIPESAIPATDSSGWQFIMGCQHPCCTHQRILCPCLDYWRSSMG